MIEVKNLTKTFDGFTALDGMTITVPKGAVYGLVGPNGSGKTTLIRHITGAYRPDSGVVTVDGERVWENNAIKSRMANIPDEIFYFQSSSINDMAKFYEGIYPRFDAALFERLSEVFPLPRKKVIRSFSKGMQKQAAFWLSLCCRPDYLILDEPVDGLDPIMRRQVWSLILSDVEKYGTTVLISSHNLRELEDVCDHVGILDHGRTLIEHSMEELQGNIAKVQLVLPDGAILPELNGVLNSSMSGRMHVLIMRGDTEDTRRRIEALSPVYYDLIPLSLEEIFIYELGGVNNAVKEIVL